MRILTDYEKNKIKILNSVLLIPVLIPAFCISSCSMSNDKNFIKDSYCVALAKYKTQFNDQIQNNVIEIGTYSKIDTNEDFFRLTNLANSQVNFINYMKSNTVSLSNNWQWYQTTNCFKTLDYWDDVKKEYLHLGEICDQVSNYYLNSKEFFYSLITHKILISPNYHDSLINNFWPYELRIIRNHSNPICYACKHGPLINNTDTVKYECFDYYIGLNDDLPTIAKVTSDYKIGNNTPIIYSESTFDTIKKDLIDSSAVYLYFNNYENNVNLANKKYITSESFQTEIHCYKISKNSINDKYKFNYYEDENQITFCENEKNHDWFGKEINRQFPHYHNAYTFNFKTPKYIMESE